MSLVITPSAMIVSSIIDFNEEDLVLNMCAAHGGKTIQASFKMHNKGLIVSNNLSFQRCGLISNNVERLGIKTDKKTVLKIMRAN